jgi:hypothetical protein
MVDEAAQDRVDHRGEHEPAHTSPDRGIYHALSHLGFVGQEGRRDIEHGIDAAKRGVEA